MISWDKINAVQRMQDYIKGHLEEPITLYELAQCTGYSPWHCAKMFKEITGKVPFEYIRMYRLSMAAKKIRDNDMKIIDVAMDFLFDSHEGFTRAFSRQFGISPRDYRKSTPPIPLFQPLPVSDYYYYITKTSEEKEPLPDTFNVEVHIFPKRKLIMKRAVKAANYFEYVEEVGCDIWGMFESVKEALYEPVGMWLPDSLRTEGTSRYVQGVEVPENYQKTIPEGYDMIELPECLMMMFHGTSFENKRFDEAVQILHEIIDKFDPESIGYEWNDDIAPRFQLEPQGWRGYIEGRPVKYMKNL